MYFRNLTSKNSPIAFRFLLSNKETSDYFTKPFFFSFVTILYTNFIQHPFSYKAFNTEEHAFFLMSADDLNDRENNLIPIGGRK